MSKKGSFKTPKINLDNLNVNTQPQGNQATWEQQRKEFDDIIENIYEPRSEDKARLLNYVEELFQYMKNSSNTGKDQQLSNLGCLLNLLGTQLTRKSSSTTNDKEDTNLVKTREQLEGSVKDFEKELEELRNRNNMYQQEIKELTSIKDKLKVMAESFTMANESVASKRASVDMINSSCSIEGEKNTLKPEFDELMIKNSSSESVMDQMNQYLEIIQKEFHKSYLQVQELKVKEKEFEMNKREDPENQSFKEKINMFNKKTQEKSLILEKKPSNELAGSEASSPKILSLGDGEMTPNPRRENEELKTIVGLLKQKIDKLEKENKQMNETFLVKNGSSKSSDKNEEQGGSENVKELKDKQKKLEATIEDLQKKIELEKVAKNQIIELKNEIEEENYQLRKEKAKPQSDNQPSQSQSGTPTLENVPKLEEQISDAQFTAERTEINLLLKEKEGFKAQVRHLTNAVNKLKNNSISLQEPLVESYEILGVIAGIEREIVKLKGENEAYQTGEQNSQSIVEPSSNQSTSQIAGLNVETLSNLLAVFDKVKPALNYYFIKPQDPMSMSSSIRKKQNSISLERKSQPQPIFNLEKMDESQKIMSDLEIRDTRPSGVAVDAISEDGREVILSEIAENEHDLNENHQEQVEYFQFTRGTIEILHKFLSGYLEQAQQQADSLQEQEHQNPEDLVGVDQTEEMQCFLAYVSESGVGEMLAILQRNRVLHEENVDLKRNMKAMKQGGSVILKDGEYNDLSLGSPASKAQSVSYYKEGQNYEDEQFSKSIVISDMEMGNQDTDALDSPFIKKRNTQEADVPRSSTKRSKSIEAALEAETKAKEDLCNTILEKTIEVGELTLEKEKLETKVKELENTYQNMVKECEATLAVCEELQQTNSQLKKTSENEIKGLKDSNKQIQDLLTKAQNDLDAAKVEYEDLTEKYNQEHNRQELEHEAEKQASQNGFQELMAKLQKEADELTEECKTLLSKHNSLEEENKQLVETNKKFMEEVQSHLENNGKAQELIKNLEKEKEELAIDCKELLAQYNQLQESYNKLNETHANLGQEAESHIENNKNIQEQILTLQKEKESIIAQAEALNVKHNQLQEEHAKLGESHEISIKDIERHLEKNKETEELISKLEKEKEALGNDCKTLLENYSKLEEAHKQLDDAHSSSKEEIQQHLNSNKDAQEAIAKVEKEKLDLSKVYEELTERYTQLEEAYKILSQSSSSSSEEVQRQLESNRQAHEQQITKLRKEKETVQAERDDLAKKHDELKEVHDQLNNSYKAVSDEAARHEENHKKAEETIADYKKEKENLSENHSQLSEEIKQHVENNSKAQELIAKLQQEQEAMRSESSTLTEEHNKLQETQLNLEKAQKDSLLEIKQHLESIKLAHESISKLQNENEALSKNHETVKAGYNKLQEEQQDLIAKLRSEKEELTKNLEIEKMRKSTPKQSDYPHDDTNIVLGTPVNKKVINILDQLNSKIRTELKAKSHLVSNQDSDVDNEAARKSEKQRQSELPKTLPKISYNILNWMADDALLVKKLCSLCDKDIRRDTQAEIKTIILELGQLNDGLRDYYTSWMEKSTDKLWGQLDFLQDLLTKCYEKQRALLPIQTKLVSCIEGLISTRKNAK